MTSTDSSVKQKSHSMVEQFPRVGVAVVVIRQGQLLLGRRRKWPEIDSWQLPGGWLETSETIFEAARREVQEKTGLQIQQLQQGPYTNNIFPDDQLHSVTLYVRAEYAGGESPVINPDSDSGWTWFPVHALPQPLFLPLKHLVDEHRSWLISGQD